MAKRVTIDMVAREAGVSRGTVDRVINQRPHVRPDQHERVMEAIRKLGYEPKRRQAQALGIAIEEKKVCRLGFLLPARNPYYLHELQRGIRDGQAQLADYSVEVLVDQCSSSPYPEEIVEKINALVEQGAQGIILNALDHESVARKIRQLRGQNIPVVTFDTDIAGDRLLFFGKDIGRSGRVAGALMTEYKSPGDRILVGMGNREIREHAVQAGAFMEAMKNAGFGEDSFEIVETYNDYSLTYSKIKKALEGTDSIRGIYMANHSLTGCMDAVRDVGSRRAGRPFVIYSDMNERVTRYLKSGELAFCVTPNVYMMGYRTLLLLKEYLLDHREPDARELFTDIEIICRENVKNE